MSGKFNITVVGLVVSFGALASPAGAAPIAVEEVARHATKGDCWIIIEGRVYDVTSYLDRHPAPMPILLNSCGKDATEGWKTKGSAGRPHSSRAETMLKSLLKGELAK